MCFGSFFQNAGSQLCFRFKKKICIVWHISLKLYLTKGQWNCIQEKDSVSGFAKFKNSIQGGVGTWQNTKWQTNQSVLDVVLEIKAGVAEILLHGGRRHERVHDVAALSLQGASLVGRADEGQELKGSGATRRNQSLSLHLSDREDRSAGLFRSVNEEPRQTLHTSRIQGKMSIKQTLIRLT